MTVVWALMACPTLLWGREIERVHFWVASVSLYPNLVGHSPAGMRAEPTKKADEANGTRAPEASTTP